MQFTASILAVMATIGFAAADPSFIFYGYGNRDTTCSTANLLSPLVHIDDGNGSCTALPAGTNSVSFVLQAGSRSGCTVKLWADPACNGPGMWQYTPAVNETKCDSPLGVGWKSVQVTCP